MKEYDVIVLGGGPAGGGVAEQLVKAGKRVAMIEAEAYGGVCPLKGCNPKKVLMSGAEIRHMAQLMSGNGVPCEVDIDWPKLMAFKRTFVDPVPKRARAAYEKMGVETLIGYGRFVDPHTVEVNGERMTAPNICIGVGHKVRDLPVEGCEQLPCSDDFLELEEMPASVVFIGGGYVAFEMAHIARRAGAEVTLLNRSMQVLREFDPDLTCDLVGASTEAGIDVKLNSPIDHVERSGSGYRICFGQDGECLIEADMVFNCTGRVPWLDGLGLDAAGVEFDKSGVLVNERMQSVSAPHIYAMGDVASEGAALTPVATIQANAAAANILDPDSAEVNYKGIPSACFTLPPLAKAGLTVRQAEEAGHDFTVKENKLAEAFPWKRLGETFGRSRVLVDEKNDRILGAHILGHNAEEMINVFALAIRQDIPLSQVRDTVWAYPTCGYYIKYMI